MEKNKPAASRRRHPSETLAVDRPNPLQACIQYDKAIPKGKGSEGGLEKPGALIWMQMLSR
ncbi:hypothetical protein DPMN_139192 [Dreissena polymorpha]|uniref:Uncharacterized protein n=1 Tax=Dreissena polymorpha TaxID=45954 RepID=A0A9D4G833_DREPO|nr:hypothetical protein DPMN_139192 [Dreissena polymorpha]